jgi:endonuclease/exonuclease/phosphatase (EEP) superfamily protein YafD
VKDAHKHNGPVVIAGDMNTGLYMADLNTGGHADRTPPVYFKEGYEDAHAALPSEKRITHGNKGIHMTLDLIFTKGLTVKESGVCGEAACTGLSDHELVWSRVALP